MDLQPLRNVRVTGEDYLPVYRVVLIEENEEHPRSWPREVFFVHGGESRTLHRLPRSGLVANGLWPSRWRRRSVMKAPVQCPTV